MGGIRRLFVNINNCFILDVTFRIPRTPMNLAIRIVPLFVSPQQWCDPVLRCANHTEASNSETDVVKRRSFLTVSSPDTVYAFTGPKLRGDHLNLCIPINKPRSTASGIKVEDSVSNSKEQLPLVTKSIVCRLHCLNSCFRQKAKERIELVVRLEDLTGPEPTILGMDRVEVCCSATQSRDINSPLDLLSNSRSSADGQTATSVASPMSGSRKRSLALTSTDSSFNSQGESVLSRSGMVDELKALATRSNTLIVGDFNAPIINWNSSSADCAESAFDHQLLHITQSLLLTQHVTYVLLNRTMINPKVLYSYIRQSTRNKDPIPLLRAVEGAEISEDKDKADHLSQFFRSVMTTEPDFSPPTYDDDAMPFLDTVLFTEEIIKTDKCNILQIGRFKASSTKVYSLNGTPLQQVENQKYLGVWITSSLKPTLNCTKAARFILQLIRRAFMGFEKHSFSKIFGSFVRLHLEFAIQAWRRWTVKDCTVLEKVQRRATKMVKGPRTLPYESRLSNLDLFPLSYRQLRGDLILTSRIMNNLNCCFVPDDFFIQANTPTLRRHPLKLRPGKARIDGSNLSFSNRVVAAWNVLPEEVVHIHPYLLSIVD
ncbi:unnamed protein product [Dibothriocephalus latus]|uniref:p53 DNA-binding domain-containing protein n=1 Tax=Dibothriocephalus latus TaxID=60516 RepID=A0A3P7L577_DIBLA|nr:unnamed protein product [Dibothriocephalus latus]